jgi:Resolvase, N terminal domain
VQENIQRRGHIRCDDKAPCPAPLSENLEARRYAYCVEAGPARPQLARPITILDDLRERGVKFRSLTEHIDTASPTGRAMWQMIGVLEELERSLISERTRAGAKDAKHRGVKFGRKRKLTAATDCSRPENASRG